MTTMRSMLAPLPALLTAAGLIMAGASPAPAAGAQPQIPRQSWSFAGIMGRYDKAQLQRGYQVYKEVCANCHAMRLLSFRNLSEKSGPEFPEAQMKSLAASFQVEDGPNDQGKMFKRPGIPADTFPSPFKNEAEARSIHNGAYPPDLSVMAKARSVHPDVPFYIAPMTWVRDIALGYQEGGPDYLYALLTGYPADGKVPAGAKNPDGTPVKLADGMNFNAAFPGYQIAMAPPLQPGLVKYSDGSPATIQQYAKDVSAFMMWAAEPKLEERKSMGLKVMIYLIITTLLLYIAKKRIWSRVH